MRRALGTVEGVVMPQVPRAGFGLVPAEAHTVTPILQVRKPTQSSKERLEGQVRGQPHAAGSLTRLQPMEQGLSHSPSGPDRKRTRGGRGLLTQHHAQILVSSARFCCCAHVAWDTGHRAKAAHACAHMQGSS